MHISTRTIDSPLGNWLHAEWRPGDLGGLLESIWYFDGVVAERRERVFPSGIIELIVHLDERYYLVDAGEATLCAPACLTGMQLAPIVVEAPVDRCRVLGIRLYPAGAYAVLGAALGPVTGLTIDLDDLVGRGSAAELVERCQEAHSGEACIRVAAAWVLERLAPAREAVTPISWIAGEIERQGGAVSIGALRVRTGLSKSRLSADFREQIGVTPKLYARIHRFRRALGLIHQQTIAPSRPRVSASSPREQRVVSLSRIALSAGYYDQAHMNAEFRELGGLTPLEYARSLRYPGSASLAEAAN